MANDESAAGKVAGLILAAGRSSRMGAFKPLLPFGKSTVVETAIANMRAASVSSIVIVLSNDERGERLKAHLASAAVQIAVNEEPNSEMAASIACGVDAIDSAAKAVLINPVDHAAVPPGVIESLVDEWRRGARLVKPVFEGSGGHPVLVDLSFRKELLNVDPGQGLKALFNAHNHEVKRLTVASNLIARDMDTWDDYRALHQELFGQDPILK